MAEPLVSVIIPAFNAERYISETIESVLSQQAGFETEIIVVDDGSTDRTPQILSSFIPQITLLRQQNAGVSAARNAGVACAAGTYCLFLDADDLLLPGSLERSLSLLEVNTRCAAVFSMVRCFQVDDDGQIREWDHEIKIHRAHRLGLPDENSWIFLNQNFWPPGAALVRTSAVRVAGGFDPGLSGFADWDFWFRLSSAYQVCFLEAPGLKYRVHTTNMSGDPAYMRKEFLLLMEKFHSTGYYRSLTRWRKSLHHLFMGAATFRYQDAALTASQFSQAIRLHPANLPALVGWAGIRLFGFRIVPLINRLRRWIR